MKINFVAVIFDIWRIFNTAESNIVIWFCYVAKKKKHNTTFSDGSWPLTFSPNQIWTFEYDIWELKKKKRPERFYLLWNRSSASVLMPPDKILKSEQNFNTLPAPQKQKKTTTTKSLPALFIIFLVSFSQQAVSLSLPLLWFLSSAQLFFVLPPPVCPQFPPACICFGGH